MCESRRSCVIPRLPILNHYALAGNLRLTAPMLHQKPQLAGVCERLFPSSKAEISVNCSRLMSVDLGSFYTKTRDARKVIVVDLGFLGDTIHLLPALHELKRNYSRAELHVMTSRVGCEVLGLASCVDRAWAIEMSAHKRSLRQQSQVLRALRREQFDVAFNFSSADRTIFMTAITRARWRVAYSGGRSHFWSRWLVPFWIPYIQPTDPVFERRREMLRLCGLELAPARFGLHTPDSAREWAATQVPGSAIHCSINAS